MHRYIICLFLTLSLSGCFLIHRQDIEQGNLLPPEKVDMLHPGMTEPQVREIIGTSVLSNIFSPDRIDYVYTYQPGHGNLTIKRVTLKFNHGYLKEIIRN